MMDPPPQFKHTPTKPSPTNVKLSLEMTLLPMDKTPPLFPSEGRNTQSQSSVPHKLKQKLDVMTSILVSWIAIKSMLWILFNSLILFLYNTPLKPLILKVNIIINHHFRHS